MSAVKGEQRRAQRVNVNIPTLIEVISQREQNLHPALAAVYERVRPSDELLGKKFPGVVKDLSTNGVFIGGEALPLLSRIACTFQLEGFGQVEALGWTLWRRHSECEVPGPGGDSIRLPAGFGMLFESMPLDARTAIARLVAR